MDTADFTIKEGDTSPAITVELRDDSTPIDLTNKTVAFQMKHRVDDTVIKGLCITDDNNTGHATYSWAEGETDTVGTYDAEFVIDYSNPDTLDTLDPDETFPSDGFLTIAVTERIDDPFTTTS